MVELITNVAETAPEEAQSWDLERINFELEKALDQLTDRQKRLVLAITAGKTANEAAEIAGYASSNAVSHTMRTLPVIRARRLFSRKFQLENGIDPAWKRQQLAEIAERHKENTPAAAVSAVKVLAQIDGDIAPQSVGQGLKATINIVTGINRAPVTVDQEPIPAVSEDDDDDLVDFM